jgi:flagellar P-ring protein FlgI
MKVCNVLLIATLILFSPFSQAERLKDIARLEGVRSNQLVGYGLVVGLDSTGDQTTQTPFTTQSFVSMLKQFGVTLPAGMTFQLKNVAAVAIHAELPPFAKPGQTLDITVSSIGNAKSLRGGSLLMSQLKGVDGQIYALAQGNLIVGGVGASGRDGSSVQKNTLSVGRIPNGAIVEREVETSFAEQSHLVFNLMNPDFSTARSVVQSINDLLGSEVAMAIDAGSIHVRAPRDASQRVAYMATLEELEIDVGTAPARIIINSRSGTVVVGQNVRVSPVAVTQGGLTVTVREGANVSQPNAFAGGETVATPESEINIREDGSPMFIFDAGVSLDDIVRAVNEVGAAPGDLMAILEAMKQAGALRAEIVVI